MKISGDWISEPATQAVCKALTDAGFQALFVGGCVRNALLGVAVSDIDISTDARPETVSDLAEKAGFRAVPTGIDHGTITVVANHIPHEITTFRRDVETDGRRAVIVFADKVEDDARRRDFTMNALYAQADGTVVDPLGGLPDLHDRHVRFIDDASARIQEDYLRILRFFRFSAWYGDPDLGFDADALAAIAENLDGLESLSKERVTSELIKLVSAPDPNPAIATMVQIGVIQHLFKGGDTRAFGPYLHFANELKLAVDPVARFVALGHRNLPDHLRLSKAQSRAFELLWNEAESSRGVGELAYRHGAECARQILALRAALLEVPLYAPADRIAVGANAEFPIKPADLIPSYSGKALGEKLKALEAAWIGSDFTLSKSDLLDL